MRRGTFGSNPLVGNLLVCLKPPSLVCRAEPVEPLFGTLVWAMWRSLRLTFRKVLTSAENKKLFLQTMVQLITTATARQTDPALLRECLTIVRLWLLEPENGGGQCCRHIAGDKKRKEQKEKKRKDEKRKEIKTKETKRKEKTTLFGVNLMRSQTLLVHTAGGMGSTSPQTCSSVDLS